MLTQVRATVLLEQVAKAALAVAQEEQALPLTKLPLVQVRGVLAPEQVTELVMVALQAVQALLPST